MLKNHLKISIRHFRQHKRIFAINTLGLALGIATCLLILLYIHFEWSYDRYNEKAERIVRVYFTGNVKGQRMLEANVMPPVAQTLKAEFPEVAAATRLRVAGAPVVIYENKPFRNLEAAYVDPNFFEVFTIPLLRGNAGAALQEPNTVILSKAAAQSYFGSADPIDKVISIKGSAQSYKVTGVIDKVPDNSHFHFDLFFAMTGLEEAQAPSWMQSEFYTYLVLPEGYDYKVLEAKLPSVLDKYMSPQMEQGMGMSLAAFREQGNDVGLLLQPLTDIHLRSDFQFDLSPHGDLRYLYIFGAIALFMLLIACINFMNLSTAGAMRRAREVGIRKVMGSARIELVRQFLTESTLVAFLSLLLGLALVYSALPWFNQITGKNLVFDLGSKAWILPALLGFGLLTGVLAGSYPAFFMSAFKPKDVLKGKGTSGGSFQSSNQLRSGLVVFQFFLSITLMICTSVVYRQLQYIQSAKLGYDQNSVLVVPNLWALGKQEPAFRQTLEQDPRIEHLSYSGYLPAGPSYNNNFFLSNSDNTAEMVKTLRYDVDEQYISALGIKMAGGRNFSRDYGTDSTAIILNEAAVKAFGWEAEQALGQPLVHNDPENGPTTYRVIGIVQDFHFKPLHERISPLVMVYQPSRAAAIMKVNTPDVSGLLTDLRRTWESYQPDEPFEHSFLDDRIYDTYQTERKTGLILSIFAGLTIFVACLGLLGLAIFTAEQRTKEIGIRKVLGASVGIVVALLSKDFLKLVLIAFVLACPPAWWLMERWLQDYAYRVEFPWWILAATGTLAIAIAFFTVSFQSIKAALADPVKSLRSE